MSSQDANTASEPAGKVAPRPVDARTKRRLVAKHFFPAAVVIVLFWGVYIAKANWDFNFLRRSSRLTASHFLAMAIGCTAIASGYAVFQARKAISLHRNGILVQSAVVDFPRSLSTAIKKVELEYYYNGKPYIVMLELPREVVAEMAKGDIVPLIIDPAKPKRFMRAEDVIGTVEQPTQEEVISPSPASGRREV
jgi:hypothetical protein